MTNTEARVLAYQAYTLARTVGLSPAASAQHAWRTARRGEGARHLRAPYWGERVHRNGSTVRNFRSPLGDLLGLRTGTFGSYCTNYPRTKQSEQATERAEAAVLEHLESMRG